jgi:CheY-like chemotaxis protein
MAITKEATILIVDDNVDFHTVATATLERSGYHVKSLYEGRNKHIRALALDCDIILLDVDLPGENGLDICKRIRSDPRCAAIPIILITGNSDVDTFCTQSGADACLVKPFPSTKLLMEVERLLMNERE